LAGAIINTSNGTTFLNIEASRRLGEYWKLNLELRGFGRVASSDYFYAFRRDTHLLLEIARYF
jgi:hypothetical protein